MKKIFIFICIFLMSLFLIPFSEIKALDINDIEGIVDDPGTTGLWHDVQYVDGKYNAYVHMRYFVLDNDISVIKETSDNHQISLLSTMNFINNYDDVISSKEINIPNNFINTLYIQQISDYVTYSVPILIKENVNSIRITFDWKTYSDFGYIKIVNNDTEEILYSYNLDYFEKEYPEFLSIYWKSSDVDPEELDSIDVGNDYNQLPLANKQFVLIEEIQNISGRNYKLFMIKNNIRYSFDINIPIDIDISDIARLDGKVNMSYSTDAAGKRYLYIQPDLSFDPIPALSGTIDDPAKLMVGFTTINLTDKTFNVVKKLTLRNVLDKVSTVGILYIASPLLMDDVISLTIEYTFRYKYFGIGGSWQSVVNVYNRDNYTDYQLPWWMYLNPATTIIDNIIDFGSLQDINKIGFSDIPESVVDRYYKNLGITANQLKEYALFKVNLGQFNKFGSTNFEFQEDGLAISNILYLYKGIVYSVDYDDIDQDTDLPPIEKFWDFEGFFSFEGVDSIGSFFNHLITFWNETLVIILVIWFLFSLIPRKRRYRR